MEDGWPLGLQLLNARAAAMQMQARNLDLDFSGSSSALSFSTLLTSTITASSSSFSSESTETPYFYHRMRGVTLQSLLNTPSTLDHFSMSSPPSSPPQLHPEIRRLKKSQKPKSWFHSLCSNPSSDDKDCGQNNTAAKPHLSLGFLLEQERAMGIRQLQS